MPKRENFSLAFLALSEPTWVCDLGSGKKNQFFYQIIPDFEGLLFSCRILSVRYIKKFLVRPKLKVGGVCLGAHMYAHNVIFENFYSFGSFMNVQQF